MCFVQFLFVYLFVCFLVKYTGPSDVTFIAVSPAAPDDLIADLHLLKWTELCLYYTLKQESEGEGTPAS